MVNVGDMAPEFDLKDQNGNSVTLKSQRGKKVLLAFYPFAFSPVCEDEFACFRNDLSHFESKNVRVMGISVDSHWAQKAFATQLGITYPLLSDFGKEASKNYGTLRAEGFSNRAYFVVDEQGKVILKQVMDSPGTKLENDVILKAVK